MKRQRKIQILFVLAFLFAGVIFWGLKSKAVTYDTSEVGDADSITEYDESVGGYSHVGVKIYWDDELECYALDTHRMQENGYWTYLLSNINGTIQRVYATSYTNSQSPIHLTFVNDSNARFRVRADMIRNGRTDYSVIGERYYKGKRISSIYEITGATPGDFGNDGSTSYSFLQSEFEIGGHEGNGYSYIYRVYSPRKIEPDGDELSLEEHGGKMETAGKAYVYKDGGLCLTKLPTASMTKEGYECKLEGWYTAEKGGSKYKVGDILQKGDVLHARWSITPTKYNVTCIDIRGNNPSGVVLGQKTWQADYGTEVSGESLGTSTAAGAYYPYCSYKGATKATVTTSGATVYRYFSYETYSVEFIDQIADGARKEEILNRHTEDREYGSTVKGSETGIDRTPGAYYEGYYYDSCTTGKVEGNGLVVYRYFKPVKYTIELDGNGAQEGIMTTTYECEYDKEVTLKKNRFEKVSTLTLYQNTDKKPEETTELTVKQKFLGWSKEKNGPVCYSDNETIENALNQEGKLTLYAVWSEETTLLPELSASIGQKFLGWAKEPGSTKGFMQINVTDSMELYAVFEKSIVKYHVEYYKENINGEYELSANYDFEGYAGEEVQFSLDDNTYPGFFVDKESSTLSGTIKADGSLILCVYYRRNSYDFSYDLNGGKLQSGESLEKSKVKFGTNITLASLVPEREGYLFMGWCQETDDTHTLFQARDSFVMQNHDVVMHAQWKKLSFKVKYDNNAKNYMLSGITGEVSDTEYVYLKDSYASSTLFQAENGEMLFWNTESDGSGITVLPGANIRGLFDAYDELTLYAIWNLEEDEDSAKFQLTLYEEKEGRKEVIDTLSLFGKAGEKISTALLRVYQTNLQGESVIYFYKGYEVVNVEELDKLISLDSSTEISLTVKERECKVTFDFGLEGTAGNADEFVAKYQDKYRLPESFSDGLKVDRYKDTMGNYYFPGDEIILEKNLNLIIEQAVCLHDEFGNNEDNISYVTRGGDYVLPEPEKQGYRFLGWYNSLGEFVGNAGDIIKNVTKQCDYYARWSEPLTYSVTFDMGDLDVKILEGQVSYHQYTKDTILPNENQVVVPEGYQFEGWYDSMDETKTLITKISALEYGDKVLKPCISKKEEIPGNNTDSGKDTSNSENQNPSGDNAENNDEDKNTNENNPGTGDNNTGSGTENNNGDQSGNLTDGTNDKNDLGSSLVDGDSGIKKQPASDGTYSVGKVFWKGKLKYKIISVKRGKESVEVVAVKKNVANVNIPSKVVYKNISYKVTAIGKKAFYKKNKVNKVVIPKTVVQIKSFAFSNMKKLEKITIGIGMKKIDTKAFYKSGKLSKVVIKSKKISKIGEKAFYQVKKNGIIQVPKSKKKSYQKLLRASKLQNTCKISSLR